MLPAPIRFLPGNALVPGCPGVLLACYFLLFAPVCGSLLSKIQAKLRPGLRLRPQSLTAKTAFRVCYLCFLGGPAGFPGGLPGNFY